MTHTPKEKQILGRLFRHGPATRAALADALGWRRNTVGDLCRELLEARALEVLDGEKARNVRLAVRPDLFYALGVRHTREGFRIALMNAAAQVVFEHDLPVTETDGVARCMVLAAALRRVLEQRSVPPGAVIGIGFGAHGIVDPARGVGVRSAHIPGWDNIPVREILHRETGLAVSLAGFTDAIAMLELRAAEPAWGTALCLWLNRSIGMSVFLDGEQLRGNHPVFAEIGHVVLEPGGRICRCGNRGCLETVASVGAIVARVAQGVRQGAEFRCGGEDISIEDVIANAKHGNKLALRVLEEAGRAVGRALAIAVNLFGISNVLLMGELTACDDIVLGPIREAVRRDCVAPMNLDVSYRVTPRPQAGVAAGAAYLAFLRYFAEAS